jgi:D-lactate dehydrogenase (cytochrome)
MQAPLDVVRCVAGHLAALHGGISLNMREMNQVLQVNPDDMDVRAQAGVTRKQLNEYIRDTGLMFTVDPGADASLGGMASTRASGTNTVKYGGMRDNVLGLTAVLADGSVVSAGSRARKSSTGYDLKNLLIGSEGTLGIITELDIRLFGQPEAVSSAVCEFPTLADAVNCTIAIIQMGVPVARVELMDALSCRAVNKYSKMDLKELPTLFFEFHGTHASVAEQAQQTGDIAEGFGASGFQWSSDAQERAHLWQARHHAYWAAIALRGKPDLRGMPTDAAVPISRLAECVLESDADLQEVTARTGLVGPLVGHVGDGNFHYCLAIDVTNQDEIREAKAFAERLAERAIRMGGTCSGEHGLGYGKLKFMEVFFFAIPCL